MKVYLWRRNRLANLDSQFHISFLLFPFPCFFQSPICFLSLYDLYVYEYVSCFSILVRNRTNTHTYSRCVCFLSIHFLLTSLDLYFFSETVDFPFTLARSASFSLLISHTHTQTERCVCFPLFYNKSFER